VTEKPARKERYEDILKQVEEAVRGLESGTLGLEESIDRYEAGMTALNRCKQILDQMEKRIEQLVQQKDGTLGARPLEAAEPDEKPAAPRRSPRATESPEVGEGGRRKKADGEVSA